MPSARHARNVYLLLNRHACMHCMLSFLVSLCDERGQALNGSHIVRSGHRHEDCGCWNWQRVQSIWVLQRSCAQPRPCASGTVFDGKLAHQDEPMRRGAANDICQGALVSKHVMHEYWGRQAATSRVADIGLLRADVPWRMKSGKMTISLRNM